MELHDWRKLLLQISLGPLGGYSAEPDELTKGNRLLLLRDGREAFPAMLDAIGQAKVSVHLETYILRDDRTGRTFADALKARAKKGVEVRIIFDSVGSLGVSETFIQSLRNQGVQVLEYRPLAPWRRRWGWETRDHRKILVVDGRVGFTGGLNLADEYGDPAEGGGGWRDSHVRLEGPAVFELERLFRSVWFQETGKWYPNSLGTDHRPGASLVRVAANQEFLKRYLIRRSFVHAIERAQKRILISTSYFIPDRKVRRALYRARRRGVEVRVLVPSRSDVPAVDYAGRHLFARHLNEGIRLFSWKGPVLHTKTMAVDGIWSSVGSYNFTHRSLLHNLEVNLHVLDEIFTRALEDAILADMSESDELTPSLWANRRISERMLESICHLCRYLF